ncbi:ubiquitin-associated domain-containing protein 1 [Bacillus rossius redtenbacheri]|uniref:ubiquitin-associated domain-containing protein 1 n=1 Tax=Bacillus rossius redtenbacheri TaxID=93214 RepID=UPI002FDEF1D0
MLPWMREKIISGRQKLFNILHRRESDCESSVDIFSEPTMFVSDTNIFSSDVIKLKVISGEGSVWDFDAVPDLTIDKIKTMALCHFYNPLECVKVASKYKLVSVNEKKCLGNDNTVLQEGLSSGDELILVECRLPLVKEDPTEDRLKGPSDQEILAATQNLEEKNVTKIHPPVECTTDFQSEIRRILISLVEASARILTPSPNADEVFALIRERLESRSSSEPDSHSLRQLVDMGFSEQLAAEALRRNRMNSTEALEWLLAGQPSSSVASTAGEETPRLPGEDEAAGASGPTAPGSDAPQSVAKRVASLLESFRAFKRKEFKPNPQAFQNIVDMGFGEDEARDALRVAGNNQVAACDWLLGERRKSPEDVDTGLDPEGPVYKAIMSNPAIQLSLSNPKILLAFLSMLENPSSANMWINDPDASPVLNQIFRTYHAEKHALHVNSSVETQRRDDLQD